MTTQTKTVECDHDYWWEPGENKVSVNRCDKCENVNDVEVGGILVIKDGTLKFLADHLLSMPELEIKTVPDGLPENERVKLQNINTHLLKLRTAIKRELGVE